MIQLSLALSEQATLRGGIMSATMNGRRTAMLMCITATKRLISDVAVKISNERYRRYAEAKRCIPRNLPPKEYEAAIKKLARKYHV